MAGLIQRADKTSLLSNQNILYNRTTRLKNELCLLKSLISEGGGGDETDPIFTASDAFSITNADRTDWTTGSSNGTTAFEWGNHASSGYAHLAGTEIFTGNKRFDGTFTLNTDVIFATNGDYNIGSSAVRPGNIYSLNTISSSFTSNTAASVFFGSTLTSQRVLFQQGTTSQIPAGLHLTTGNFFLQAAGTTPVDSGFRLDVTGTSKFTGNITVAGNILFDGNSTRDVGSSTNKAANIWSSNFLSSTSVRYGGTSQAGNILYQFGTSAQLIAGFQATTGNMFVQSAGIVPADSGFKLDVGGTFRVTGQFTLGTAVTYTDNTAAVSGGLTSGQIYKTATGQLMIVL
jgi:hypothetical protein